jgi:hypothetical protein
MTIFARLKTEKHYPAGWVFRFNPFPRGALVPVVEATNIPRENGALCYWVNTPELENDCYGVLLHPGEFELVQVIEEQARAGNGWRTLRYALDTPRDVARYVARTRMSFSLCATMAAYSVMIAAKRNTRPLPARALAMAG